MKAPQPQNMNLNGKALASRQPTLAGTILGMVVSNKALCPEETNGPVMPQPSHKVLNITYPVPTVIVHNFQTSFSLCLYIFWTFYFLPPHTLYSFHNSHFMTRHQDQHWTIQGD